jgi:hypothetical protein
MKVLLPTFPTLQKQHKLVSNPFNHEKKTNKKKLQTQQWLKTPLEGPPPQGDVHISHITIFGTPFHVAPLFFAGYI